MSDPTAAGAEKFRAALESDLSRFAYPNREGFVAVLDLYAAAIEAEAAARAVDEALSVERVAEALWFISGVRSAGVRVRDRSEADEIAAALVAHLRGPR